jgi:MATE family multidrug resistance protein
MSPRFPSLDKTLVIEYVMRSYPIAFSTLNVLALEAMNTVMSSRIGTRQAAAVVLANTLLNVFKKANTGLSVSLVPLVEQAHRRRKYNQVTQIFKQGLVLNALLASLFCLILLGFSYYGFPTSHNAEITMVGHPYLRIIAFSLIPSAMNNTIRRYLEGISFGKIGLLMSFFTLTTNVLFNFLLLYGWHAFPRLGLNGVGIAILLSEVLTVLAGMLYVVYVLKPKGYLIDLNFKDVSESYFSKIWNIGWLAGLQFGLESIYLLFIAMLAGRIGIEAQAAHAILFNICQLITIFSVGLGLSSSMLVAQQQGTQNGLLVRKVALTGCTMIWGISILVGLILVPMLPYIVSFYSTVATLQHVVQLAIKHLFVFQLLYGLCYWGNSVLRGLDDRVFPFLVGLGTQFLGAVGCYITVIHYQWGIHGVWIALIIERMLLGLFLFIRFETKTKKFTDC